MTAREYTAGFLFCGLGAGARGFLEATGQLGPDAARFRNLGGIDNDPLACADFEYLTGGRALCADLSAMQPAELRAAWGNESPDAIFTSPPCKGLSGLLSAEAAKAEKYQRLNRLVVQGMFLACETWARPPGVIILENVPRITSRGAELLAQVRQLLGRYGYLFHEAIHDCGEVGGLAQHRRRFLLIARQPARVPAYIYRPPKRRVRACGEVLGELPLPDAESAGDLHRLPRLSWLNWVRLALIPAGGDWRDLPGMAPRDREARRAWEQEGKKTEGEVHWFKGKYGVQDWEKPSRTVVGGPSNGASAVADPRLGLGKTADGAASFKGRPGLFAVADWEKPTSAITGSAQVSGSNGVAAVADPRIAKNIADPSRGGALGVIPWDEPAPTVTGAMRPGGSNTPAAVADPRLTSPLDPGQARREEWPRYDVRRWDEPARTVAGSGTNAGFGVADPRASEWFRGVLGVVRWEEPAPTVTGQSRAQCGSFSVADPRVGLKVDVPGRHHNKYVVNDWAAPARTVIGATRPGSGALSVADPRLKCAPRAGAYGVMSWEEAAATVTGAAAVDNGRFAVADPREPGAIRVPIIIAADGTWHRPLTTLELATLQGLPAQVNGAPLKLAGRASGKWRERIGNAVPVQTARAVAETILKALLAASLGTWFLSNDGVWVHEDGTPDGEELHPSMELAP